MGLKKGDKVKLKGAELFGSIVAVSGDGSLLISLDNGIEAKVKEDHVTPITSGADSETHDSKGRFRKGHRPFISGKRKNRMKAARETILEQLEPFLGNLGVIVEQIEEPGDKILAMSRILPYAMPKLSSIEVSEKEIRNLSAEERIAKLNAAYHKLKDPTEEENEDD